MAAPPTINSLACLVINRDTGVQYYELNEDVEYRLMSFAKLMSVRVLLDHYSTRAAMEAVNVTVVAGDEVLGESPSYAEEDDVHTLWTLFMCGLLPSSNNAMFALGRHIGQKIIDEAGPGSSTDAVDRFVENMNIKASDLGMGKSDPFTCPDGFSSVYTLSLEDYVLLMQDATLIDNAAVRQAWQWKRMQITFERTVDIDLEIETVIETMRYPGVVGWKNGLLSGTVSLFTLAEMPNGQEVIFLTTQAQSPTGDEKSWDDYKTLYDQLLVDHPALGVSADPWTPTKAATAMSCDVVAWDEDGDQWQDQGEVTAADATSDPVDRWNPSYNSTATDYILIANGGTTRPLRQADGSPRGDGINDYLALATDSSGTIATSASFETTDFFCAAGEKFMVGIGHTPLSQADGTMLAKASSGSARQFYLWYQGSTWRPGSNVRNGGATNGHLNQTQWDVLDKKAAIGLWDPDEDMPFFDLKGAQSNVNSGTDANQTTEPMMFLAAGISSPTWVLNADVHRIAIFDDLDYNHERRLHAWLQGAAVNAARDVDGGVGLGVRSGPLKMGRPLHGTGL